MHVPDMTELGKLNASDRVVHEYTFLYDEMFAPMRYISVRILDIGYARGRGTRMLAEFFPRSVVHSFDIEPNWKHYNNLSKELKSRVYLYKGDQSSPNSIKKVLDSIYSSNKNPNKRGYKQFDIIIDDGSHKPEHQQTSFNILWNEVKPGGFYVIEDFHMYYKDGNHPTVGWLFDMIHKLNKYGDKTREPILKDIQWILFSYNQVLLRKKVLKYGRE